MSDIIGKRVLFPEEQAKQHQAARQIQKEWADRDYDSQRLRETAKRLLKHHIAAFWTRAKPSHDR